MHPNIAASNRRSPRSSGVTTNQTMSQPHKLSSPSLRVPRPTLQTKYPLPITLPLPYKPIPPSTPSATPPTCPKRENKQSGDSCAPPTGCWTSRGKLLPDVQCPPGIAQHPTRWQTRPAAAVLCLDAPQLKTPYMPNWQLGTSSRPRRCRCVAAASSAGQINVVPARMSQPIAMHTFVTKEPSCKTKGTWDVMKKVHLEMYWQEGYFEKTAGKLSIKTSGKGVRRQEMNCTKGITARAGGYALSEVHPLLCRPPPATGSHCTSAGRGSPATMTMPAPQVVGVCCVASWPAGQQEPSPRPRCLQQSAVQAFPCFLVGKGRQDRIVGAVFIILKGFLKTPPESP